MIIGILALQGAFIEHKYILDKMNIENILIKKKEQIKLCDGIILPGGESTAMSIIDNGIIEEIQNFIKMNNPVWGTCAGLILLSKNVIGKIYDQKTIGELDILVERNHFGSQSQSFIEDISYPEEFQKNGKFKAVFIRAPVIKEVYNDVKILSTYQNKIIAVQQNNMLGTSFHPELMNDFSWHEYFVELVKNNLKKQG